LLAEVALYTPDRNTFNRIGRDHNYWETIRSISAGIRWLGAKEVSLLRGLLPFREWPSSAAALATDVQNLSGPGVRKSFEGANGLPISCGNGTR
jgi:hypothetical protein